MMSTKCVDVEVSKEQVSWDLMGWSNTKIERSEQELLRQYNLKEKMSEEWFRSDTTISVIISIETLFNANVPYCKRTREKTEDTGRLLLEYFMNSIY